MILSSPEEKKAEIIGDCAKQDCMRSSVEGHLLPKVGGNASIGFYLPHSRWHLDVSDLLPPLSAEVQLSSLASEEPRAEEWEGNTKGR